jgi:hypothetical protein
VCGTASIDFLDRRVSAAAVQSFPFHMMAVQDFPHPKTVKELPCWLLANSWCGKSIVANKLLGLQATGHLLHARCHLHLCSPLAAKVLKTARELIYTQQTGSSAISLFKPGGCWHSRFLLPAACCCSPCACHLLWI